MLRALHKVQRSRGIGDHIALVHPQLDHGMKRVNVRFQLGINVLRHPPSYNGLEQNPPTHRDPALKTSAQKASAWGPEPSHSTDDASATFFCHRQAWPSTISSQKNLNRLLALPRMAENEDGWVLILRTRLIFGTTRFFGSVFPGVCFEQKKDNNTGVVVNKF